MSHARNDGLLNVTRSAAGAADPDRNGVVYAGTEQRASGFANQQSATAVGSEEARRCAGLRPPLKLRVRVSRM